MGKAVSARGSSPFEKTDENVGPELVELDPDHPGFRDPEYRARRNEIARLALSYRPGAPLPEIAYTPGEHAVWQHVWKHLAPVQQRYACEAYLDCSAELSLDRTRIPQLGEVNQELQSRTGFRMLPVSGLVSSRDFMERLGDETFLSTQYVRHQSCPLYTPEPDVVHELVGHAATLAHPVFATLNRAFGEAVQHASEEAMTRIGRVYWYTLEFGLVEERGASRAYGAGLLSSFGELEAFRSQAELRALDLDEVALTPYDPTTYQRTLFVVPSLDELVRMTSSWLTETVRRY